MKKEEPKVTVVTATFNLIKDGREDFFRQCVESVHNQTYKNIEHLIIDGASTDGTIDLIKEYADKGWIKYISEPDKGMCDAMNKGIKMAKGEYVAILNSDDFYSEDMIELSVEALQKNNADYSYSDTNMLDRKTLKILYTWYVPDFNMALFYCCMPYNHESMLCKKSVYEKLNYYNYENWHTIADYDFAIKLILNDYKSIYINKALLQFRMDGTTNYAESSQKKDSYYEHISYVFKRWFNLWSEFLPKQSLNDLKKIYSGKRDYFTPEEFNALQEDWFVYYFIKYLAEKNLKNYKWDALFQNLLTRWKNNSDKLKLLSTLHNKKLSVKLFNCIPFLTIKQKGKKTRYKLFGFLPLFKVKEK